MSGWILDGVLGLMLLGLGMGALQARNLYGCVLLFIAFGLVLSLVWARLGAADLALAEAAIGAGLSGTLLFAALAHLPPSAEPGLGSRRRLVAALALLPLFALLISTFMPLLEGQSPLPALVQAGLPGTGASHPVTAVLLDYRAWDTLLELVVVLLALLGARQLGLAPLDTGEPWPLLQAWSRRLAPLLVLAAGYLVWRGGAAPGGAFQAGALLAGGLVLLRLVEFLPRLRWSSPGLRLLVALGPLTFLAVAAGTALAGRGWLDYPDAQAGWFILGIEAAATLSIAVSLSLLVIGEDEGRGP